MPGTPAGAPAVGCFSAKAAASWTVRLPERAAGRSRTTANVAAAADAMTAPRVESRRRDSAVAAAPPDPAIVREATDRELRAAATHKVAWESLSLDSRRRILDPMLTPEFQAPKR